MSTVTSETQIANLALNALGVERIDSLTGTSKRAKLLNDLYRPTRNDILESAPWNFAMRRVTLTPLASSPDFGFDNQFQLPSDCLRVWSLSDTDPASNGSSGIKHPGHDIDMGIDYRVEGDKLLADIQTAYVIYIKEVTDVSVFSSGFVKAFYLSLAAEACYSINQNTTKENSLLNKAQYYIDKASSTSSQEDELEDFEFEYFINPRFT